MWALFCLVYVGLVHSQKVGKGKGKMGKAGNANPFVGFVFQDTSASIPVSSGGTFDRSLPSSTEALPPTAVTSVALFAANDMCPRDSSVILCADNHIRLCSPGLRHRQAFIARVCARGCSTCAQSPDVCNDSTNGANMCPLVPPSEWERVCFQSSFPTSYCDNSNIRVCTNARGIIAEYCPFGCRWQTMQCNPSPDGSLPPSSLPTFAPFPSPAPAPSPAPPTSSPPSFPGVCPRIRREWSTLPNNARERFVLALRALHDNGQMRILTNKHFNSQWQIHGDQIPQIFQFLIWHRVFVFELEELIRAMPGNECVTVPFWNYEYSHNSTVRAWPQSVFGTDQYHLGSGEGGCIGGMFDGVNHPYPPQAGCIRRNPREADQPDQPRGAQDEIRCAPRVDAVNFGTRNYTLFATRTQWASHGHPHFTFGETFGTHNSPIDPLFFVHHCNVDRLWDMWQDCHQNYSFPLPLNSQVFAYPGVRISDFVDNQRTTWRGRTYNVSYASDRWQDPAVYSTLFRQAVVTQCQGGRLSRYENSPVPIRGVDLWAFPVTPQFVPVSVVAYSPQVTVVDCDRKSPFDNYEDIKAEVTATYDNQRFSACLQLCSKFFFKDTGSRNCLCTEEAARITGPSFSFVAGTASVPVQIFYPRCLVSGADPKNYAVYSRSNANIRAPTTVKTDICFDPLTENATEIADELCSPTAPRPAPIPKSWLAMNNISLDATDICKTLQPATGQKNVNCIYQV